MGHVALRLLQRPLDEVALEATHRGLHLLFETVRGGAGRRVVATTLGMTEADVRDAISNGQTLAQLAEAKGSTGQALIDAILADHKTHLDEKVVAGDLTQAEADAKLAEATTRVDDLVNNTDAANLRGPGPGHGPRHGAPGPHVDDAEAAATT